MRYRPSLEEFVELARHASVVPVYRQLIGDTLTPVTAFCKIQEGDWSFLFESVGGGERLGRYSFLGSGPFLRFQAYEGRVQIRGAERGGGPFRPGHRGRGAGAPRPAPPPGRKAGGLPCPSRPGLAAL